MFKYKMPETYFEKQFVGVAVIATVDGNEIMCLPDDHRGRTIGRNGYILWDDLINDYLENEEAK